MSYTTLYKIDPSGKITEQAEFSNSHRGAAMVWENLWRKYLPERQNALSQKYGFKVTSPILDLNECRAVWRLYKDIKIPRFVRSVLLSTFDHAILEKDKFQDFYDDVLKYSGMFAAGSLVEQANAIIELNGQDLLGVCWNQTSVSDTWGSGSISEEDPVFIYTTLEKFE